MKVTTYDIKDLKLITPDVFGDHRGFFMESYSLKKFSEIGIDNVFVQDNHSMSAKKGTLRGLHFQNNPKSQSKLFRCTKGAVIDVAVDLRKDSATYKQYIAVELSEENKKMLYIPKGFAHGFVTLTDNVEVQYKTDEFYAPECDRSIRYDDPELNINWGVENPILSEKDLSAPLLADSDVNF